ncbi:dihydrofolate reductase family protein [Cellulomonas sp. NTE-D12]|uniref:dihydrofolate reductase family protein n=1 Tax=Cellulomonas sp. NTE-D12 TaxID=2962632 RepID=UPI003081F6D1|nr:riboflavin biosynthesis protein RibD [Cellulomonas sp. NTE-D12]
MHQVIISEFGTLDGVVEDPDGSGGGGAGAWAFRFGREAIAGDVFRLGPLLETGTLLLGRRTWELFRQLWPTRTDPFSLAMNRIEKVVVSRGTPDLSGWDRSTLLAGDLLEQVPRLRDRSDVLVLGSIGVAQSLVAHDLVDEYRLLTFPTLAGAGRRLFEPDRRPAELTLGSVEQIGETVLTTHRRQR